MPQCIPVKLNTTDWNSDQIVTGAKFTGALIRIEPGVLTSDEGSSDNFRTRHFGTLSPNEKQVFIGKSLV